ncbi:MAG: 30S ribosomal protein S8 [Candidatus Aminicenantes bacterium]|nr:30S ribosomal protein S8 [Candidatus Aminicenantes bacterium]
MSHTDPIADLLTRIRNAARINKPSVDVPYSKVKEEIVKVIKKEGYVSGYEVNKEFPSKLVVKLKSRPGSKINVIEGLERISKPGRRVYSNVDSIPKVIGGMGVSVLSTSKGIFTGKECEKNNIGGEILFNIW